MSKTLLHSQVQPTVDNQSDHSTYELKMSWRIRWFFAILIGVVYIPASFIGCLLAKNWYPATPDIFIGAIYFLVPMNEKRYQLKLKALEIQKNAQITTPKPARRRTNNSQMVNLKEELPSNN